MYANENLSALRNGNRTLLDREDVGSTGFGDDGGFHDCYGATTVGVLAIPVSLSDVTAISSGF